ncbi:MAG: hypothetical protein WDN25_13170 [Acetobacteraceae bacterium]
MTRATVTRIPPSRAELWRYGSPHRAPARRRAWLWVGGALGLLLIGAAEFAAAAWMFDEIAPVHVISRVERSASSNPF